MSQPRICVVGSSNIDLVTYTPRFPKEGETLHGHRFATGFGGKGANQAVMAARLGGQVSMLTKLGNDAFGRETLENYRNQGIDTRHIAITQEAASGVAIILVDDRGANEIVIAAGANMLITPADVEAARSEIESAQNLVLQLEIPIEANLAALRIARQAGVMTIFNPAPAQPSLPAEAYTLSDLFCPNETEAELLSGQPVQSIEQATAAGRVFLERGARQVIITLGARGSLLVTPGVVQHVPAPVVKAVDTTGAGDSFIGSLAYFLAAGKPLIDAMQRANQVAAISVQSPGTQSSFPYARDLPAELID